MKAALLFVLVCISCAYARNISGFPSNWPLKSRTKRSMPLFNPVEFVNVHNMVRGRVYPPPSDESLVSWDIGLAFNAQHQANLFTFEGSAAMSIGQAEQRYRSGSIGINIGLLAAASSSATEAVLSWESEKTYYNYITNSCHAGHVCGHYTQVVWHNSTKIGCGVKDHITTSDSTSPYATLVVCHYSPGGNIYGERPYPIY